MARLIIVLCLLLLIGCHRLDYPGEKLSLDHAVDDLNKDAQNNRAIAAPIPTTVMSALAPNLQNHLPLVAQTVEKKIDISVRDMPANEFLMSLIDETDYDISVPESVKVGVTLSLKQVTVPEIMEHLRDTYGIEYKTTKKGFEILPLTMVTKTYALDYLNLIRTGKSAMRIDSTNSSSSGSGSESTSGTASGSSSSSGDASSEVSTESKSNFWDDIQNSINAILGKTEGASIVTNPQASLVIVHASLSQHRAVKEYFDSLQNILNRQVILDVKIMEVHLNKQYQAGIDWASAAKFGSGRFINSSMNGANSLDGSTVSSTIKSGASTAATATAAMNIGSSSPTNVISSLAAVDSFSSHFNAILSFGRFAAFVQFLEGQGNVQVLSSPRISTINNQKAIIKVGSDDYHITKITNNSTLSAGVSSSAPTVETKTMFSGIALDVTPQISSNGDVRLHVHPSVSEVTDIDKEYTYDAKTQKIPLSSTSIRESDNIIVAKSGQIVVIGGLMKNNSDELVSQVPILGNIPYVGSLFRQTRQNNFKSELVIMIRPTVVDDSGWANVIEDEKNTLQSMKKGFHLGTGFDVFGSQGEREWR